MQNVFLLSLLFSFCFCTPSTVSFQGDLAPEYSSLDYETIYQKWTRNSELFSFSELERVLTVSGTFKTKEFQNAYIERFVKDYRISDEQKTSLLLEAEKKTKSHHEFFLSLYGNDRKTSDISKDNSIWTLRLIDSNGNETAPESIELIKKPSSVEKNYYPHITSFRYVFRILFPTLSLQAVPSISKDAKWFSVRFSGAPGICDLIWKVENSNSEKMSTTKHSSL